MRERYIEAWLRTRIEQMGGEFWKFASPGRDGVPDRIALFPGGRLVFVEVKADRGRLTKLQEAQLRRLMLLGQQVCVVFGESGAEEFLWDMKHYVVSSGVYGKEKYRELAFEDLA